MGEWTTGQGLNLGSYAANRVRFNHLATCLQERNVYLVMC